MNDSQRQVSVTIVFLLSLPSCATNTTIDGGLHHTSHHKTLTYVSKKRTAFQRGRRLAAEGTTSAQSGSGSVRFSGVQRIWPKSTTSLLLCLTFATWRSSYFRPLSLCCATRFRSSQTASIVRLDFDTVGRGCRSYLGKRILSCIWSHHFVRCTTAVLYAKSGMHYPDLSLFSGS